MTQSTGKALRSGWTTGACATAAARAAALMLFGTTPNRIEITLPRGQIASFTIVDPVVADDWAEAGIIKDAGDDPDVTHGAQIRTRVVRRPPGHGIVFHAGEGVGTVTQPGLPISPGEPAINPVPRRMIIGVLTDIADANGATPDYDVTISVLGGAALAKKTWNGRLGIVGGLSILGTTGIVRPYSCSAWIASLHRGIDVARAAGLPHVMGATGATSEAAARTHHGLPEIACLDMGDFAGGVLKYMRAHPVPRLTVAGGFAKLTKLAQGSLDLHSARSQVDFSALAVLADQLGLPSDPKSPTALAALETAGNGLAQGIARQAHATISDVLHGAPVVTDVMVVDRAGSIIGHHGP
ncbi:MAG: cobalt-precorrin-5B (C(1))-methyltransferase [Pseudomonadota bacterium]